MESKLNKRALNLSYFTIIYNIVEGVLSIFAGLMAGNTSLLGFGLDSVIESFSGTVILWRFRKGQLTPEDDLEKIEKKALKYYRVYIFNFRILCFV